MRILVTGGAGFIGSEFVRQTLARYPNDQVTVLDKLTYAGNLDNLQPVAADPRYRFVQGDIADREAVERALEGCQAVVNFAAETHVDRSILEPDAFVKTDVLGTWTLAEAARAAGIERFVHISTDEVYGAVLDGASGETDRLDPTSPYSAAKAGGELLVLASHKTYGLDTARLLRLGWQPSRTFWEGLEATVLWYAEHPEWWQPIKSGEHHRAYYQQNYADRGLFAG
jgi:dTDP-glucose 4,6-dehydratase